MKSLITALILIGSISLSYAETGQELQLKKEGTDGPSLEATQKYIKEKLESIRDAKGIAVYPGGGGVGTGYSDNAVKMQIDFDDCNLKLTIREIENKDKDTTINVIKVSECKNIRKLDIGYDYYEYYREIKATEITASCSSRVNFEKKSYGVIFDTFVKDSETVGENKLSVPLSQTNYSLNYKIAKAICHLEKLCSDMKPKRDIKDKDELF